MGKAKNERIQVRIEDMGEDGAGIGRLDGYIWFIKDTVIGDLVEATVMKAKKSYGYARLAKVLAPSPYRVEPRCPVARQCGGCQLQAVRYEEQLRFKESKVLNHLKRIGGFHDIVRVGEGGAGAQAGCIQFYPIIGMEDPWRYRNKAQFPFGRDKEGRIVTGFYAGRTHTIIPHEDCLLGIEENAPILECVKRYMEDYRIAPYDEKGHTGLVRHVLIRKGFATGELMVCLVINGRVEELKERDELVGRLVGLFAKGDGRTGAGKGGVDRETGQAAVADGELGWTAGADGKPGQAVEVTMASISCSVNRDRTNVIMGTEIVDLYGPGYITDSIGPVRYRISPLSFYQVNPVQTRKLYETALDYAGLTGKETVWDLYCGIGTISLFLARQAKQVYGVEVVGQAIEDARANAAVNGIRNVEFFVGKAEAILPEQYAKNHVHADVIVVDPPRKGCDTVCLDTIVEMRPERVVYVSCDSATLARDLRYLADRGFGVERVRCCDMFGMAGHVETVALLTR